MYRIKKTLTISASHTLHFSASGVDEPVHGHNWRITVWCEGEDLDPDGMLVNFLDIEELVKGRLDHRHLNDVLPCSPSAENLARWICEQIPLCIRVDVEEYTGAEASYIKS